MSLFNTVMRDLEAQKGNWPEVAKRGPFTYSWLSKLGAGKIPSPNIHSIERLQVVLNQMKAPPL